MFYVDQFVYSNKLRSIHPMEKFLFAIVTMGICLSVQSKIVHLLVLGLILGILYFKAGIPGRVIFKLMSIPLSFLLISVLAVALSFGPYPGEILAGVKLGGLQVSLTSAGVNLAVLILLRSLSAVACLYFLALTVPMIELIYVFQLLRVPVLLTELMMLIYRFIFVFIDTAFNIYTAQSSRWGYSSFRRSMNSFGLLFANLWGKAFFKSQALYNSMLSRGYEKEIRVLNPPYFFSPVSMASFLAVDLCLVAISWMI